MADVVAVVPPAAPVPVVPDVVLLKVCVASKRLSLSVIMSFFSSLSDAPPEIEDINAART